MEPKSLYEELYCPYWRLKRISVYQIKDQLQSTIWAFNQPVVTTFGSIDRGGFNRLKPEADLTAQA